MKRLLAGTLVLAIVMAAGIARGAESPTGTWKWEVKLNDQTIDLSLN